MQYWRDTLVKIKERQTQSDDMHRFELQSLL